jgi:hypothetical protein
VVAYPQSNPNERSTIMFTKDFIDAMIYYDHKSYETETNITFDSNGNWVEKRVRTVKDINGRPGNNISTTKRKIAYR